MVAAATLTVSGCAKTPTVEETQQSLQELQRHSPTPALDDELTETETEYSVENTPDPIADPLECSEVLIVSVRGTNEPVRGNLLSPISREVREAFEKDAAVTTEVLDYPASADMAESGTIGVRLLVDTLNQQAATCPDQATVLLGYSQGSLVVGDALTDGARVVGRGVGELTDTAKAHIAAVVLYADPRFVASEPYASGDFDPEGFGLLEREPGALAEFADRLMSFCAAEDFICQGGTFNETGHVAYFDNGMQALGTKFVTEQLKKLLS